MSFIKFAQLQFVGFMENAEKQENVFDKDSPDSKKALAQFKNRVVEHRNKLSLSKDFTYIRTRAIGGLEKWGPNQNGDGFPLKELQKSYSSFVGKGNFIDHKSDDIEKIRGLVVDAYMNNDDHCIECLIAVDRVSHPQLVRDIETGVVNSVSMGTRVGWSACSVCANIAKTEHDYCSHIKGYKGMKVSMFTNNAEHKFGQWPVHEVNHELEFIELSWVSVPAFKEANVLEKIASLKNLVNEEYIKTSEYKPLMLQKALDALQKHKYGIENPEFTEADALRIIVEQMGFIKQERDFSKPTENQQVAIPVTASIPENLKQIHNAAQCKDTECDFDIRKKGENVKMAGSMIRLKIDVTQLVLRKTFKDFKANGKVTINNKEYDWVGYSTDKRTWHINLVEDAADQISAHGVNQIQTAINELLNKNVDMTELIVSNDESVTKIAYLNSKTLDPLMKDYLDDRYRDEKNRKNTIYDNEDLEIVGTKGKTTRELEDEAFAETAKEGPSGALGKELAKKDQTLNNEELEYKKKLHRAYVKYLALNKKG